MSGIKSDCSLEELQKLINSPEIDLNTEENRNRILNVIKGYEKNNKDTIESLKYDLITENNNDVMWTYDIYLKKLTYISPSIYNLTGYTPEEYINFSPEDIYSEESLKKTYEQFEKKLFKKGQFDLIQEEKQIKTKNSGLIWILESHAPVIDENGDYTGKIAGVSREIEATKKLKQMLLKSEEQYKFLIEKITDVIWVLDLETRKFTFISPSVKELRGYSTEEIMRQPMEDALTKESAEHLQKVLPARLDELKKHPDKKIVHIDEISQPCKDGSVVVTEVHSNLHVNKETGYIEVVGVSRDITQRKELEEKLREKEEKYRLLTEKISDVIWILNLDKNELTYVSPAMTGLLGYTSEEIKEIPIKDQMDAESFETISKLMATRYKEFKEKGYVPDISTELNQKHKNGNIVTVEISTHYRYNNNGEVEIFGVSRDITKRKQMQERLMQSEAKYKTLFHNTKSVMLLIDPKDGAIIDANESACKFYGYSYDEITKLNIKDINISSEQEIKNEMQKAKNKKRNYFKFKHKLSDGVERHVEVFSSNIIIEGKELLFSIIHDVTEKTVFENLLDKERNQFISILDSIPEIIYVADIDTYEILYANRALKSVAGENIVGKKCYNVIQNKKAQCSFCTNRIISEKEDAHIWEHYNQAYDKHYYIIDKAISWYDGRHARFEIAIDITQMKKSQEELEKSKELFETVFENANIGTCLVSTEGNFLKVNQEMVNIFGYSKEEFLSSSINSITFPADLNISVNFINDAINGKHKKAVFEKRYYHKNGKLLNGEVSSTLVENDDGEFFISHVKDITAQKKAEKEIRKMSTAVYQSPANIVITDVSGIIEYVNPAFTKQTGYEYDEAVGHNPRILKSGKTPIKAYRDMWTTLLNGKNWKGEFINKRKDGSEYWELAHISPIKDDTGRIINFLAIKEDITDRKKSEIKLKKTTFELERAIDSKDKFFSIIAHDLRSPFNALLGYLELLIQEGDKFTDEEKETFISNIFKSALETFKLLENLLIWSNAQSGMLSFSPKNVKIKDIIYEVISLSGEIARQKEITLEHQEKDLTVAADEDMVKTILRNLISNAIKFTPKGGKIILDAYDYNDKFVRVDVEDTGMGMEWDVIDNIFKIEKHYSTPGTENEHGTGLGLTLVQEFVRWHGGKIWVESIPGTGSVFSFTLPKKMIDT